MAFVTYKLERSARRVEMVYETQGEANSAASGQTTIFAQTGSVNDRVQPGDFINSAGHLLTSVPAGVRDEREKGQFKDQIQDAFSSWVQRRPLWLVDAYSANRTIGNNYISAQEAASRGSLKQIIMLAALGDAIIEGHYLSGLTRTNRNSFIEHIVKAINDDYRGLYDGLINASATARNNWSSASVEDKAQVYSNIITSTLGTPKDPDTSYTAVSGVTIPDNFDPSQEGLRR